MPERYFYMALLLVAALLANSCEDEKAVDKLDPAITWLTPADIAFGTLLNTQQLNATANVPGTFTYKPGFGEQLNAGEDQNLSVEFFPTESSTYNTANKTVNITVTPGSNALFNTTIAYGVVNDIDGNVYKTTVVGTQTWMAENLRTTKYRNGESIAFVTNNTEWKNLTSPAYCNYENTTSLDNIATMGRLYRKKRIY